MVFHNNSEAYISSLLILLLLSISYRFLVKRQINSIPRATPALPLLGNSIAYRSNPINFLISQQVRHGDIFSVDLAVMRIVFFMGAEGVNAVLKGTENSGLSMFSSISHILGGTFEKCMLSFPNCCINSRVFGTGCPRDVSPHRAKSSPEC